MSGISSEMQVRHLKPYKGRFDLVSGPLLHVLRPCTRSLVPTDGSKREETHGLNTPTRKVGEKDCLESLEARWRRSSRSVTSVNGTCGGVFCEKHLRDLNPNPDILGGQPNLLHGKIAVKESFIAMINIG